MKRVPSPVELARESDIFSVHLELGERTQRHRRSRRLERAARRRDLHQHRAPRARRLRRAARARSRRSAARGPRRAAERAVGAQRLATIIPSCTVGSSTRRRTSARRPTARRRPSPARRVRILRSFVTKGEVPNVVNIAANTWSRYQLVVRHIDKSARSPTCSPCSSATASTSASSTTRCSRAAAPRARRSASSRARPTRACRRSWRSATRILHVDLVTLPNLA